MKIYTAHWKYSNDELYYSEHNRKMFLNREDADAFLTDLMDYEHIERYYVLEEDVNEQFVPMDHEITSDWECCHGTLHPYTDHCDCDEYIECEYSQEDLKNEYDLNSLENESYEG
jgi:hypothetical protein